MVPVPVCTFAYALITRIRVYVRMYMYTRALHALEYLRIFEFSMIMKMRA